MSQASDIAVGDSEISIKETHDIPSPSPVEKEADHPVAKGHEKIGKESILIERPGCTPDSWERWLFSPDREPELLSQEMEVPKHCDRRLSLPSSTLFAWPLWVAAEEDALDLVRMELSGRHLLKRGMEESLVVIPIFRQEDRQLLLAVAPEIPFPGEIMPAHWKSATRFELPARLLSGSLDHDLILWEEWGGLHLAFYRNQYPVWFCGMRPHDLTALIHRISLRLLAEGVLEQLPTKILLDRISDEIAIPCIASLAKIFPRTIITRTGSESLPPPRREDCVDIPPTEAREERRRAKQRQKLLSFAIAGVILYLLLLFWGAGDLFIRESALKRLLREIAKVEQPALDAQQQSSRWHLLRPVIDPNTYPLDLLAAVALPTDGGTVRLTLFSLEQGTLHISGEAGDLTQANNAIESLKKNPLLQEFDWSTAQPQLAGKNSVKFDLLGSRPDAAQQPTPP